MSSCIFALKNFTTILIEKFTTSSSITDKYSNIGKYFFSCFAISTSLSYFVPLKPGVA